MSYLFKALSFVFVLKVIHVYVDVVLVKRLGVIDGSPRFSPAVVRRFF